MPALKFIFDGDATPFSRALNVLEKSAARSGSVTIAQMKGASAELQRAAAAAREAGKSTVFYDYAIEGLNQKIQKYTALQEAAAKRTNELALAKTKAAMAGGGESVDLSGRSLSDRYGADARIQRRLDARRTAAAAEIAAAEDAMAIARAKAARINVDSPEMRRRALISTYQRESTPGFIGPKSLSAQQVYEAEQTLTTRRNRAAEIRRDRAAERAAAAERLSEEQRQASVEAATRNNRLRELLRQRAAERKAHAERLAEEARIASVEAATRSNQARKLIRQRAEERAESAASTRATIMETATFGVSGMGTKFSGINAGWTQMVHVMRASVDSIASGISPMRVAMQQIPQAMQAMFLMGSKMPGLKYFIKDTSLASEKLAVELSAAATQSSIVAAKSILAAEAEATLTGATSASAIAAKAKATADQQAALAASARAKAAQEVAAIERASVGPSGLAFRGLTVAVAAVATAVISGVAVWALYRSEMEKVSQIATKLFRGDYIAQKDRSTNSAAELQKEINREILKSVENYHSAASAADRLAEAEKNRLDHLKDINSILSQREKDAAETPEQKFEAEKRAVAREEFAREEAATGRVNAMIQRRAALEAEQKQKQTEAAGINVTTESEDDERLKKLRQYRDEALDFLEQTAKARGSTADKYLRAFDITGQPTKERDDAAKAATAAAKKSIEQYNAGVEAVNANKELRQRKADLGAAAVKAGSEAATVNAAINTEADKIAKERAFAAENNSQRLATAAIEMRRAKEKESDQTFDKSLQPMTVTEKKAALQSRIDTETKRAELYEELDDKKNPEAIRSRKKAAALQLQLDELNKSKETGRTGGGYSMELTSNQRIGAYISGPQISLLDVNRQMDAKLAQIVKNTTPGAGKFSGHIIAGGFRGKQ